MDLIKHPSYDDIIVDALVTIIVPIYNTEKYLIRCIESILAQTYHNIEIILVDDGSEDQSGKIIEEYAKIDQRIIVIHKSNRGLAAARNEGIKKASGQFLFFLDSDDSIEKMTIEHLVKSIVLFRAQICLCRILEIYENQTNEKPKETGNLLIGSPREFVRRLYLSKSGIDYGIICNKLFDKRLFEQIQFPEGKINEDDAVIIQLYYLANKIIYIDEIFYNYFHRGDSITGSGKHLNNVFRCDFYRKRHDLFQSKGDKELIVLNAHKMINDIYSENIKHYNVIQKNARKRFQKEIGFYLFSIPTLLMRYDLKSFVKGVIYYFFPKACILLNKIKKYNDYLK